VTGQPGELSPVRPDGSFGETKGNTENEEDIIPFTEEQKNEEDIIPFTQEEIDIFNIYYINCDVPELFSLKPYLLTYNCIFRGFERFFYGGYNFQKFLDTIKSIINYYIVKIFKFQPFRYIEINNEYKPYYEQFNNDFIYIRKINDSPITYEVYYDEILVKRALSSSYKINDDYNADDENEHKVKKTKLEKYGGKKTKKYKKNKYKKNTNKKNRNNKKFTKKIKKNRRKRGSIKKKL
jgi:hypothetical protein